MPKFMTASTFRPRINHNRGDAFSVPAGGTVNLQDDVNRASVTVSNDGPALIELHPDGLAHGAIRLAAGQSVRIENGAPFDVVNVDASALAGVRLWQERTGPYIAPAGVSVE